VSVGRDPVAVARLPHRSLAEMVVRVLEDAGMEAWREADDAGGAYPSMTFDHPARVFVDAADQAFARNVLATAEAADGEEDATGTG